MLDLLPLYQSLVPPVKAQGLMVRFSAHAIPGFESHRVGMDEHGAPCLLLSVSGGSGIQLAPIALEHLTVQHDAQCRLIKHGGHYEDGRFTVIRCTSVDSVIREYFLRAASPVVAGLPASPTAQDAAHAINQFAELFRSLTAAPRQSVQGLWSELFLIGQGREPKLLAGAWRLDPEEVFDFGLGNQRIDVKSASTRERRHHFALRQVSPPVGVAVLIASVFVEGSGGGLSLASLLNRVRQRIEADPELVMRVDRIVALTLGAGWRDAMTRSFDEELARQSLAFYQAEQVPSVDRNIPADVSDVRFVSRLTAVAPVSSSWCRSSGGLFRAALHR